MKKLNKKGFTLAELLIVVAIITVLTAIAVPLFTSSVSRAQETTFQANKSAVKSAVLVAILADKDFDVKTKFPTAGEKVYFTAKVDTTNGTISDITEAKEGTKEETKDYATWQSSGEITVALTRTDVEKVGAAPTGE